MVTPIYHLFVNHWTSQVQSEAGAFLTVARARGSATEAVGGIDGSTMDILCHFKNADLIR